MSDSPPTPVGRHRASDEEVDKFNDAFWSWSKENGSDDLDADLKRFAATYTGRAVRISTDRGAHTRPAAVGIYNFPTQAGQTP